MPVYLDEEMVGRDTVVGYPHLLLCMGLGVLVEEAGQRSIIGIHLTSEQRTSKVVPVFAQHMFGGGFNGRIIALYGSCNRLIRYPAAANLEADWKKEMTKIAGYLNYRGVARGFDTGIIEPRDGTYVQYNVNPVNGFPVRIYYKQNDRMKFGENATANKFQDAEIRDIPDNLKNNAKIVAHYARTGTDRFENFPAKSNMSVNNKKFFGKSDLNEVDYSLRLTEVFVAP